MVGSKEKAELLNSFFASVFTKRKIVQPIKSSIVGDSTGMQVKIGKDLVGQHLSAFKSLGSDLLIYIAEY